MNDTPPITAPAGAVAWTPGTGYLYHPDELHAYVEAGDVVLVVSDDGMVRGVTATDGAPLSALLRVDGDLAEIVARIDQLADRVAGVDTGLAVEVSMLKGRVRQLENRGQV